ncbi:MAG: sulfatase [Planctomycetota bacterium]|nr:sulfatase [Planctomycetota bacterium]
MDHRDRSARTAGFQAAACLLALTAGCATGASEPGQPNVIVVVVDTLRADHMSLHGYARKTTPRIDARAQDAVVFDRASSGSSWTVPSMAMMFTGSYKTENVWRLDEADTSFVERFQESGYRTGAVVTNSLLGTVTRKAMGDAPELVYESGFERGFDSYEVFQAPELVDGKKPKQRPHGWYADEVFQRGAAWVEATDEPDTGDSAAPYLLYLHLYDPHHPRRPRHPDRFPWKARQPGYEAFLGGLPAELEAAPSFEDYTFVLRQTALYDAEVAAVDVAMGQLFGWLEERGELDDTVVVLTADHGEGLWQRALPAGEKPAEYNKVPALYADHGVHLFDEQVHVPLVLWGPGVGEPRREPASVSLVDLAPTLYELADLAPPAGGADLSGLSLVGDPADLAARRTILAFCSRGASLTRDGRWRLHVPADYRVERFGDAPRLFDLREDPAEVRPLDDPAREAELAADLAALIELLGTTGELTDEEAALRRELLDAMGYTGQ